MEKTYLTIPQVAEYLQMSKTKVYDLVAQDNIPYLRIGRNVRIEKGKLEEWLEKHTLEPVP